MVGWDREEIDVGKLVKIAGVTLLVYVSASFVKTQISYLWMKMVLASVVWLLLFLVGYFLIVTKEMKMIVKKSIRYLKQVINKLKMRKS